MLPHFHFKTDTKSLRTVIKSKTENRNVKVQDLTRILFSFTIDGSAGSRYGLLQKKRVFNFAIYMSRSTERTISIVLRLACTVAIVVCITAQRTSVLAQQRAGTAETDKVQPVNSGPNPYRVIRDWAQLTLEKRPWGGSNGVAIDQDGKSVWATDRCSPGIAPGCLGTKANPVHLFDETGKEIRNFGGGMFVWPHGIHVDRDGNVWVTDARVATAEERIKFPGEDKKGSVVIKFSPDGKVLMTLGRPGVKGDPPDALTEPNGRHHGPEHRSGLTDDPQELAVPVEH